MWNSFAKSFKFSLITIIKLTLPVSFLLQVSLDAMFDVQVKRIHEYKRQLLNIFGIIHRYDCLKVDVSSLALKELNRL